MRVANVRITTPEAGARFTIPDFILHDANPYDSDGDGLHNIGEFVVGSDPNNTDSDDDDILDGAEVRQGTDPNGKNLARTGIVAALDTPGTAVDICAVNDVAIIADSDKGISVFNVFNGMNPIVIAQIDTPGSALAVACSGDRVVVGDGYAGVAIVDISDPPAGEILYQIDLDSRCQAVASGGGIAYAGLRTGRVAAIEIARGFVLDELPVSGQAIHDLVLEGDYLYALTQERLHVVEFADGALKEVSQVASPGGGVLSGDRRKRLFVGGGIAYGVNLRGYNTIDVSDPRSPSLILFNPVIQAGWMQIVLNGSGLGLAAYGLAPQISENHNVYLYDVSDPMVNDAFVSEFRTPGAARAVAIYNGIGYVAAHENGLQVINYLSFDTKATLPKLPCRPNLEGNSRSRKEN